MQSLPPERGDLLGVGDLPNARTCRIEDVRLVHAYAHVGMIIRDRSPAGGIRPSADTAAKQPDRRLCVGRRWRGCRGWAAQNGRFWLRVLGLPTLGDVISAAAWPTGSRFLTVILVGPGAGAAARTVGCPQGVRPAGGACGSTVRGTGALRERQVWLAERRAALLVGWGADAAAYNSLCSVRKRRKTPPSRVRAGPPRTLTGVSETARRHLAATGYGPAGESMLRGSGRPHGPAAGDDPDQRPRGIKRGRR
jgi:hypothetical protein